MPPATASGSDAANGGASRSRDHNQGNQDRKYTLEQKAAVIRVRKCNATAFYDILGLEEVKITVTDSEIKKAYRKLSLLTHPDKNGHEHADEAFKMVSRAFGVLGDPEKKQKYDRYGGDPDSRFGGSAPSQSPFSGGFGGRAAGGGGGGGGGAGGRMWDDEISPEEMFNRFFGGGGMGGGFGPLGGGMFDTGPQFVFNLGGGPGIRVHQFGGTRPRRRPREAGAEEAPRSMASIIASLLPLLVLFVIPILSSLFSGGDSTPAGPQMRFNGPEPPYTAHRMTPDLKVDYYVNPADVAEFTARKFSQLDHRAEVTFVQQLRVECENQMQKQQRLVNEAQGWFFQDELKMTQARNLDLRSCRRLEAMRVSRGHY